MQLNISWAEPLDRGASQGVFTPVTGYDLVISMGPKLSGVPSANGMAVGASENITVIPLPDSGKKRESAVVENLVKGMSYFVYVRARNTAFDFKGNGPWSDGMNHSDVYVFVCVLLASLEYALLNCLHELLHELCSSDLLHDLHHRCPDQVCRLSAASVCMRSD